MSKIMRMLKKFWWVILIGVFMYYNSDPVRKSKMMEFLSKLPLIGSMMSKNNENANLLPRPPAQAIVNTYNTQVK